MNCELFRYAPCNDRRRVRKPFHTCELCHSVFRRNSLDRWHVFYSGHRALYRNDLVNMDVSYRKLCRQIVGPPPGTHWRSDWYEILHSWEKRVAHFAALANVKSWSQCVCTCCWKLARYVAYLPSHGGIKRVFEVLLRPRKSVFQTVGFKNYFPISIPKMLEIGWTQLKINSGESQLDDFIYFCWVWVQSKFCVYILLLVHISFVCHACAQWARHCFWSTGSARLHFLNVPAQSDRCEFFPHWQVS